MTNLEILAELKKCWEYLNDIDNNGNAEHCGGQLNGTQISHINYAMIELAEVYNDFRQTIDDEETQVSINGEIHHIGKYISEDYVGEYDSDKNYTYWYSCADLNYFWYEDYDFLVHDIDETYKVEVEN